MTLMQCFTTSLPGLDWSEDSADDADYDEEEAETCIPFQSSWKPQNGSVILMCTSAVSIFPFSLTLTTIIFFSPKRLEEDNGSSRRTRLLRLCSYLREKYKHMCRQERASIRQKRYRYAFRKALLHAASNNPDSAGKLIQELRGVSQSSSRYYYKFSTSQFYLSLWTNMNTVCLNLICP